MFAAAPNTNKIATEKSAEPLSAEEKNLQAILSMASSAEDSREFERAERLLLQALAFSSSTFGENSLHSANMLQRLASFYSRREHFLSARPYIERLMSGSDTWDTDTTGDVK